MPVGRRVEGELPVRPYLWTLPIAHQESARRQRLDALEHRLRGRHVLERQEVAQALEIWPGVGSGVLQHRLDFGAEHESAAAVGVVQRLDAQPVACQQQPLPPDVPERECEHAAQLADTIVAGVLVQVDDRFRVAVGGERVTAAL